MIFNCTLTVQTEVEYSEEEMESFFAQAETDDIDVLLQIVEEKTEEDVRALFDDDSIEQINIQVEKVGE